MNTWFCHPPYPALLAAEIHRHIQRLPIHGDRESVGLAEAILLRRVHPPDDLPRQHVVGGDCSVAQLCREEALGSPRLRTLRRRSARLCIGEGPKERVLPRGVVEHVNAPASVVRHVQSTDLFPGTERGGAASEVTPALRPDRDPTATASPEPQAQLTELPGLLPGRRSCR